MTNEIRVAINGFGRIGRMITREFFLRSQNESFPWSIVAINNTSSLETAKHLFKYDSTFGVFPLSVDSKKQCLIINENSINYSCKKNIEDIPWEDREIDIVIDATGLFREKATLGNHLKKGVKKVILCAPGKDVDATFVMGINHKQYDKNKHHIISNASCTTNCLAPIVQVLQESFGIESGFMTTTHSYTGDQRLLDASHSDLRRARSAACNIIPTSTGAARALGLVIPSMSSKLDGLAMRVPTSNVSLIDLSVITKHKTTQKLISEAMRKAKEKSLEGILGIIDEPLVSSDILGRRESSLFDEGLTFCNNHLAKVISWYDNEAGFSNRVIDLTSLIADS